MRLDHIVSLFDQTDRGPVYSMEIALFLRPNQALQGTFPVHCRPYGDL